MTATPHPLAESRRLFLTTAATLDRCRDAYHEMGDFYSSTSLELVIDYLGESARILDKLIEATTEAEELR